MLTRTGHLPTIPEYYREMINKSVDLTTEPKQCCPFHKEDTPSFSYSAERGVWRCFGGCKCGGDVIDLHRKNYDLKTREDAERSLNAICGILPSKHLEKPKVARLVNEDKVNDEALFQKIVMKATTVARWLELDYLMSKTPVDYEEMQLVYDRWSDEDIR